MRIVHALLFAAATAVSFSAAAHPTVPASSAATVVPSTLVPVKASSLHRIKPGDAARLTGSFQLEDGRVLRVSTEYGRLYAELGGKRRKIVAVGPGQFSSLDDALRVRFDQMPAAQEVSVSEATRG